MKTKVVSILSALLAAVMITTTVFAGSIKLSGSAQLGSIIFKGYASGLGKTDYVLEMSASGDTFVVCTNYGSNDVPGQSSPKVTGKTAQDLLGNDLLRKNGRAPVLLTVKPDVEINPTISWQEGGCPNSNWTARVYFVDWKEISIDVKDTSGRVVDHFDYTCTTAYIPQNDGYSFDDGTVSCTQVK